MRRTFTAPVLVILVLVCPYLCLGASTNDRAGRTSVVGCSCCKTPVDENKTAPRAPDRSDSDCLCRGAVFNIAKMKIDYGHDESLVTMRVVAWSEETGAWSHTAYDFSHACHFPPGSNGREVCALTCSLLL